MNRLTFELSDGVTVGITIIDVGDGTLKFDLAVQEDTGTIGDLNGLFFDIADESLLGGLVVEGADVTDAVFKANAVTKVDSYNTVNGEVAKAYGKFDAGIQFDSQGIGKDDIQTTSFVLSHDTADLSLDSFLSADFAVRLTSVGEIDGARDGSVKIGGTAPDEAAPIADDPGNDGDDGTPVGEDPNGGDIGPIYLANNDFMSVSNTEGFSEFGLTDPLSGSDPLAGFVLSILENDTMDDVAYTGAVVAAQGQVVVDSIIVAGTNGGLMLINSDGTVDFSANDEFDYLAGDDTASTQFTYEIDGEARAIVEVEVFALGEFPGGGVF